jgi:hypothetical protein
MQRYQRTDSSTELVGISADLSPDSLAKPLVVGRRLAVSNRLLKTRFASEDDWFDHRLEHHPEFIHRIDEPRAALREGRGIASWHPVRRSNTALEPSASVIT